MDEDVNVDELVDEIIGEGDTATVEETCKQCGDTFRKPKGSKYKVCPACRERKSWKKPQKDEPPDIRPEADAQEPILEVEAALLATPASDRPVRLIAEAQRLKSLAENWRMAWSDLGDALNAAYVLLETLDGKETEQ